MKFQQDIPGAVVLEPTRNDYRNYGSRYGHTTLGVPHAMPKMQWRWAILAAGLLWLILLV